MIKSLIFIFKYKILKEPINLSYHLREFIKLSKNTQRKVLDKYFEHIDDNFKIESYFDVKEARYYDGHEEVTFFNCYYFDKLSLEHDIYNVKLIDKFKLPEEKINYLINYTLEIIEEDKVSLDVNELVNYLGNIPDRLGKNVRFMKYLIDIDYANVKYLIHNELCPAKQRELIGEAIKRASENKFDSSKFLMNDKKFPSILINNIDFIMYLIKNDVENVKYLNDNFLNRLTVSNRDNLVKDIIYSLKNNKGSIEDIESNAELAIFLNKNEEFVNYMVSVDVDNIKYVDWHNLVDESRDNIIKGIVNKLRNSGQSINIMNYDFRDLFFQNYSFMEYLVSIDFRWIAVNKVNTKDENDKLISIFLEKIKEKKYKFRLSDFLEDGSYLNYNLVENKKMLHYLFSNGVKLVQHINFFNLKSARTVVENLVDELEKTKIDYEFNNEDFIIEGKYPVVLSNSYRFMRYVIDKNFNNIAYIDISMIDKREKMRIINYAFRMVYYIRGKNKSLNFDIDGYFKNSMIINDEYFQECLRSL